MWLSSIVCKTINVGWWWLMWVTLNMMFSVEIANMEWVPFLTQTSPTWTECPRWLDGPTGGGEGCSKGQSDYGALNLESPWFLFFYFGQIRLNLQVISSYLLWLWLWCPYTKWLVYMTSCAFLFLLKTPLGDSTIT